MARKIFINYRRGDSSPTAGRLRDHLAEAYGDQNVFMDVESIPAGVDFVDYLKSQMASYDVFLVLIGPDWLQAKDDSGHRRIDNADDPVTMEITSALQSKSRVVPVTIDGAIMPTMDELPTAIKPLARRNAIDLRNNHFLSDVSVLIAKIGTRKWWHRWPARVAGTAALLVLAVGVVFAVWPPPTPPPPPPVTHEPTPAPVPTPTPMPAPTPIERPGQAIERYNVYGSLDIFGQDIPQPSLQIGSLAADIAACAAQCDSDTSCAAFSFDPWKRICYPKSKIVPPRLNAGSISATKKPATLPSITNAAVNIAPRANTRVVGQPRLRTRVADFKACRAACLSDSNNMAFSFLKTVTSGPNCELFRSAEDGFSDNTSIDSGFKYQ